jgi:phage terminase Nu1 subunit (DNA packaging protein)
MSGKRCKVASAAEILGESERTVRNKAAAGLIPGAAKLFGTWSFDVALLHAFVAEKEREVTQARRRADVSRATTGTPLKVRAEGNLGQTIKKLRLAAKQRQDRT